MINFTYSSIKRNKLSTWFLLVTLKPQKIQESFLKKMLPTFPSVQNSSSLRFCHNTVPHQFTSPSSSSSISSSIDFVKNPFTAIVLHPDITLPPLIPSQISLKLTNFATFRNIPNTLAQISLPSPSFSKPSLTPLILLQILDVEDIPLDRDDSPIANLIPRRSRYKLPRKPPTITISVEDTAPVEPSLIVSTPCTPHTHGKKQ